MKTIKRSIALVLAMILTLAMSVTVFAAPNADQNTFSLTLKQDRLLSAVMLLVMLKNSVVLVTTLQSLKSRRRLLVQT